MFFVWIWCGWFVIGVIRLVCVILLWYCLWWVFFL